MHGFISDLRFALRLIRRSPGVPIAAVVTLALGIGLNAATFTILNGILFRPRTTVDPSSFVRVQPVYSGTAAPRESTLLTTVDYLALRDRATTLHTVAAWSVAHARFGSEASEELMLLASCNFFEAYGLTRVQFGRVRDAGPAGRGHQRRTVEEEA